MEVLYRRCCGLDVHKRSISACLRTVDDHGHVDRERRTFGTMTADLLALSDWLRASQVSHVAMESTGVFWKPVYNVLEDGSFELILANAQAVRNVPGRKTDVQDAEWLADLLAHGLIKASYVPDRGQRELRELMQYRRSLVQQRSSEVNRVQKVLEGANLKLASVASDILGVSGRAILEQIAAGETDPDTLADLAQGRLRNKTPELRQALHGRLGTHQRFMLRQLLDHIDYLDACVAQLELEIDQRLRPFEHELARLTTAPGIGRLTAQTILAVIPDLGRFSSPQELASWAGLSPGNNESAGKRRSGRTTGGNRLLRDVLIEAAWAAVHTKDTYLSSRFRQLATRRGAKRAIVAIAHDLLTSVYYMLTRQTDYVDLGPNRLDPTHRDRAARRLTWRIEKLGYRVSLTDLQAVT